MKVEVSFGDYVGIGKDWQVHFYLFMISNWIPVGIMVPLGQNKTGCKCISVLYHTTLPRRLTGIGNMCQNSRPIGLPVPDWWRKSCQSWDWWMCFFIVLIFLMLMYNAFIFHTMFLLLVELVRQNGGRVLLHCKAGISRSATICLAYLMFTKGYSLEEAYQYVHSRRSVISPNLNFMRQLDEFEKELLTSRTSVLASTLSAAAASTGVTKTFTWPLPSVTIGQGRGTEYLGYDYDYSPLSSPTLMVSSLLTPS